MSIAFGIDIINIWLYNLISKGSNYMLLIISKQKRVASDVAETFRYMSILAYGATPSEALSEVSELYRAALIISPETLADTNDFVKRIRKYKRDLPIFAITDEEVDSDMISIFDAVFRKPTFSPALATKIIQYANEHQYAKIGDYRLGGIDASWDRVGVSYFDIGVSLTKTEAMILRYLIRSYPLPKSSHDIIKYVFKSSRAPEVASIRTHLSIINKKFEAIMQRRAVVLVAHEGYLISTPEYIAKGNLL